MPTCLLAVLPSTCVSTNKSDVESVIFSPTVAITSETLPSMVEGRSYLLPPTLTIKSVEPL